MSDLHLKFSSLGPMEKAMFLAHVAHMATIEARASYTPDIKNLGRSYDHPDAVILREANNFIHRVTGYLMTVLTSSELTGQDVSVMRMIEGYYRERGLTSYLPKWLETSNLDPIR